MYSPRDWRAISIMVWQSILNHQDLPLLFFDDIAHEVDIDPRHINYPLSYIMEFCERKSLPPLTAIVMNKHDYLRQERRSTSTHFRLIYFPSDEAFDALYLQQVDIVRNTDWSSIVYEPTHLTFYELRKQLLKAKHQTEKAPDLTRLVKARR